MFIVHGFPSDVAALKVILCLHNSYSCNNLVQSSNDVVQKHFETAARAQPNAALIPPQTWII